MYNLFVSDLTHNFEKSQPGQKSALKGFYLVRTYTDNNPFTTLSDIDEEKAQGIMKQNYGHIDDDNIKMRHKVEEWLREGAQRAEISMERKNPIYFAVIKDLEAYKSQLPGGYKAICYPMDKVDLSSWSFVMDDSFISAPVEVKGREYLVSAKEHDLHGRVLTSIDVTEYLISDVSEYEQKGEIGHVSQFEAHMWCDEPRLINDATCSVTPLDGNNLTDQRIGGGFGDFDVDKFT